MENEIQDDRLVQCPQVPDVYYFDWHCIEQILKGVGLCVGCEAVKNAVTLQDIMDDIARL